MSDQNDSGAGAAATQTDDAAQPQLRIDRIFLKDASFESPSSPEVFLRQWRPELKLDINTQANRVSENQHQVVLTMTVTAQLEG
ncbi:MAG TPA: protein-export chaperone SecB, partial [Gammaproteobacteria bacterium]|nr:protein-export chaperone SecB [Gammaproteobacteria bacterium]